MKTVFKAAGIKVGLDSGLRVVWWIKLGRPLGWWPCSTDMLVPFLNCWPVMKHCATN